MLNIEGINSQTKKNIRQKDATRDKIVHRIIRSSKKNVPKTKNINVDVKSINKSKVNTIQEIF